LLLLMVSIQLVECELCVEPCIAGLQRSEINVTNDRRIL
jgi:hypothetical protein